MQQATIRLGKTGEGTMKHYAEQLMIGFQYKILLSILGTIVAGFEGFYSSLVWGFLSLFTLDLLSGLLKSKKNGVPISSKKLRNSVTKLGGYMILITALIIAGKYEASFQPIVSVAYYYFMFTELKSIFENAEEMGIKIPFFAKSAVDSRLQNLDPIGSALEDSKKKEEKNNDSD